MVHDMMNMMGGMGWVMGLVWLLLVLVFVLGVVERRHRGERYVGRNMAQTFRVPAVA